MTDKRDGGPIDYTELRKRGNLKDKDSSFYDDIRSDMPDMQPEYKDAHKDKLTKGYASKDSSPTFETGRDPSKRIEEEARYFPDDASKKDYADNDAVYYAATMISAGYSESSIRAEFERNNYSSQAISEIFKKAHEKLSRHKQPPHRHHYVVPSLEEQYVQRTRETTGMSPAERIFAILYSVMLIFLVGWTNIQTGSDPFVIFISFTVTFATILASFVFLSAGKRQYRIALWIVPIFASIIWYGIAISGQVMILAYVDAGNIVALNFILSMVYLIMLDILKGSGLAASGLAKQAKHGTHKRPREEQPHTPKRTTAQRMELEHEGLLEKQLTVHEQEKEIETYIQSIEDKSKAINFVIGRVYSNKHGGSDKLRSIIRIDKEWYNVFASIPPKQISKHLTELRKAVYSIGERLDTFTKPEAEVFGAAAFKLTNLRRKEDGTDTILDVLIENDKDPVATYYKSAVEFCNKAIAEIDQIARRQKPEESAIIQANTSKKQLE